MFINLPLEKRADNLKLRWCHLVNLTAQCLDQNCYGSEVTVWPPAYQSCVYLKSTCRNGQQQTEGPQATGQFEGKSPFFLRNNNQCVSEFRAVVMSALSFSIHVTMTWFALEYCMVNVPGHLVKAPEKLRRDWTLMCMFAGFPWINNLCGLQLNMRPFTEP